MPRKTDTALCIQAYSHAQDVLNVVDDADNAQRHQ